MHDIRGSGTHLVEGSLHRNGYKIRQSGLIDDGILCEEHEAALSRADDYGVRFCRSFAQRAKPVFQGHALRVESKRADLLEKFVYSIVWRHVVSAEAQAISLSLGPYELALREAVFSGSASERFDFIVTKLNLRLHGRPLTQLAMAPFRTRIDDVNVWRFALGELLFDLKLDRKPYPKQVREMLVANGRSEFLALSADEEDVHQLDGVMAVVENMTTRPGRPARRA